ncbi:ankyrin repeat-containing protein ITN1-like [Corylus avellana]|uniref:ankyrin repeat-containing protein ITN1-like n=1 Tax=Corylus avellana TaxID=13451 RepID=UPI00286C9889|nr:ankyrin repeat-containing protein ITN1-like [Corylus avellana]
MDHPWRRNKSTFDGNVELECAPDVPSRDEVISQLEGMVFGDENAGQAREAEKKERKKQKTNNGHVVWKKKNHQPPKAETSTESTNNKNSGVFKDVTTIGENGAQTIPVERDEGAWRDHLFPPNYVTCFEFVKLACKALLVVLGQGSTKIRKIQDKKEKHTWSVQIMNELLQRVSSYEDHVNTGTTPAPEVTSPTEGETRPYTIAEGSVTNSPTFWKEQEPNTQKDKSKESEGEDKTGEGINKPPGGAKNETTILITAKSGVTKIAKSILEHFPVAIQDMNADKKSLTLLTVQKRQPHELLNGTGKNHEMKKRETPILIAAKNGITEIVEKILERFPVAIHDRNAEKKNIVLLAVENRQPHVYKLLLKRNILKDTVFRVVDNEGNSALHLAAKLGDYKPWLIPGAALQMQWEIKWYEFVKDSMPLHFFTRYNKEAKTPKQIFTETHKDLIEKGCGWLDKTSESCSVVAALIATVAFATSSTVPGGVKEGEGTPTLENQPAFDIFAISSLVALCFSVTAVVMFLAILTSRYQERDFGRDLPTKLLVGLTSLFVSIASMLISFCAGHFFVLKDKLQYAAFPLYAVTCLPVTFFAVAQFPLYFDLIWATFKKVPQRSYKAVPL